MGINLNWSAILVLCVAALSFLILCTSFIILWVFLCDWKRIKKRQRKLNEHHRRMVMYHHKPSFVPVLPSQWYSSRGAVIKSENESIDITTREGTTTKQAKPSARYDGLTLLTAPESKVRSFSYPSDKHNTKDKSLVNPNNWILKSVDNFYLPMPRASLTPSEESENQNSYSHSVTRDEHFQY